MPGTSSNTSFFSFGPDDSFISKSFEGLRYRHLPPTLHQLIVDGSVLDVHWAALGPVKESWALSFKDSAGKNNLGWGTSIPSSLQQILKTLTPTQHLRVFLGPGNSFIAWDPSFIRWANLPLELEKCLQSWLTPAGWKSGPPRLVTWNEKGASFAMSEYSEVSYQIGSREGLGPDEWSPFQDTVREWNAEEEFKWNDIAYLNLDSTDSDQFIAIRTDHTWSGSIESDANEEALEAFAQNFFSPTNPKSKTNPNHHQTTTIPTAATQALYETWATETAHRLALALIANTANNNTTTPKHAKPPKKLQIRNQSPALKPGIPTSPALLTQFPYLPPAITTCTLPYCVSIKRDRDGLRACKHDVERLFRASGSYGFEWLRQERIRWHPDRFGRLCEEGWRETGRGLAEEMFKIVDCLIGELEGV